MGDNDIRFDYDLVIQAISNRSSHEYSDLHLPYVVEYRNLIIKKVAKRRDVENAYIIATKVTDKLLEELEGESVEYILIETTKDQCFEYLEKDDSRSDKDFWRDKIDDWFEWYEGYIKAVRKIRTKDKHIRSLATNLQTRSESEEKVIEGYFIVFNSETELWSGAFEEVAPGALDNTLNNDIRALINHDTKLVLGRNKANTLELKVDSKGLWGSIKVNEKDLDAVNLYERVKRGDVDQCSFGFNIVKETTDFRDDGTVKWTIEEIDLHEVSVVTFPAYDDTAVQARMKQKEQLEHRKLESKKIKLKERLNKC
ncbi:MAG: HK97 family phage prohead protease [Clostridiaceae bacterium]|nr:HK97 family phage prohead protease [Clostridiaceae bacterium]